VISLPYPTVFSILPLLCLYKLPLNTSNRLFYCSLSIADPVLTISLGLHLKPEGYRVLYKEFSEVIAREWPDLVASNIPFQLPPWDRFDDEWKGEPCRR
jgi:hypothetical protein